MFVEQYHQSLSEHRLILIKPIISLGGGRDIFYLCSGGAVFTPSEGASNLFSFTKDKSLPKSVLWGLFWLCHHVLFTSVQGVSFSPLQMAQITCFTSQKTKLFPNMFYGVYFVLLGPDSQIWIVQHCNSI